MDALTQLPWSGLQITVFTSGWTLVAYIVVLLLTGRGGIALRSEVETQKAIADTFKTAWETAEARADVLGDQMREVSTQLADHTTYLQTADKVLQALDENRRRAELREELRAEGGGS